MTDDLRRHAFIVDIDGTMAIHDNRSPFDWHLVDQDLPNYPVIATVEALLHRGFAGIIFTGRPELSREKTEAWLDMHIGLSIYKNRSMMLGPYMRPDERMYDKDVDIKRDMYNEHVKGQYHVVLVLDDRDQVVKLWRHELGLPCFQVAEAGEPVREPDDSLSLDEE